MKKKKDYTIIALLIPFLIAVAASCPGCYKNVGVRVDKAAKEHICSDNTHATCDGNCECDGLGCVIKTDYQINLHNDTVWIYDGNRLVGSYISKWTNQMDTILLKDNQ